jgi:hypothetical protein
MTQGRRKDKNTMTIPPSACTKRISRILATAFLPALLLAGYQNNRGTSDNPYIVPRAQSPIKVDGNLDEPAWTSAVSIPLDYEISPRENVPPPVKTEILLTYDSSHFYIGFRCYDPDPSKIRAHFSEREKFSNDDWVAVEIDTYNDTRRAFTLFSTAAGVQMDGVSDAAGIKDYTWDMIYNTAARIFPWGYGVEMAIPFSSLRFQRTRGPQTWGLNAVRGYPREVAHQIWARPYDRSNNCRVCQYMKIRGFENVSPGRNIEINPTLTALSSNEKTPFPGGEYASRARETEAGLTARWGITPNLVMSGTVNPDFSQVEADAAQLDINQPFALYYPERRPFFTEGLDFFQSPLSIIYTRTLRNPQWGMKLSGKEGANALGAYLVRDNITNLIFPGSQSSQSTSLSHPNTAAVLRYGRDIWNNSTIGVLFTNRSGGDYYNRVYGLDGRIRFSSSDEVVIQYLRSDTRYERQTALGFQQPAGMFSDDALSLSYAHKTRYHTLFASYKDIGGNFRADLGFLPQVGLRSYGAGSNYTWINKKKSWWTRFELRNTVEYTSESDGTLLYKALDNSLTYRGSLQSLVNLRQVLSEQTYNGRSFGLNRLDLTAGMTPTGNISLYLFATLGENIDYINTRKGDIVSATPSIAYNLGAHLRLNLSHVFERMRVESRRLYTANISQGSIIYHFNTRLFLRAQLQYVDYDYNPANYLVPYPSEYKKFFSQILFSYKLNPRTVLFLGYTDNYFGGPQYRLTKKDYTFFVKIGYAWVI